MAETRTPPGTRPPAHRWPRLRADLRLVHDNPVTGRGQVRVVDPRTGRQFAFTARENLMLQAADGQTDVDTLATRLAAFTASRTAPRHGGLPTIRACPDPPLANSFASRISAKATAPPSVA